MVSRFLVVLAGLAFVWSVAAVRNTPTETRALPVILKPVANEITPGMSIDEVTTIVGHAPTTIEKYQSTTNPERLRVSLFWKGQKGKSITAVFDDGLLTYINDFTH